jgi:hypothetical protein
MARLSEGGIKPWVLTAVLAVLVVANAAHVDQLDEAQGRLKKAQDAATAELALSKEYRKRQAQFDILIGQQILKDPESKKLLMQLKEYLDVPTHR